MSEKDFDDWLLTQLAEALKPLFIKAGGKDEVHIEEEREESPKD